MESCLRPSDTVARLGCNEMAVLLDAPGPVAEAPRVTDHILEQVMRPFDPEGNRARVGASIDGAVGADERVSADMALRNADAAMHEAN